MASTSPWSIPLFDETLTGRLDTLLNMISNALNTALNKVHIGGLPKVANKDERDALFPNPVQGDGVFRKDLGYEERYYSAYNATSNPGGASIVGWHQIGRQMGRQPFAMAAGIDSNATGQAKLVTFPSGRFTKPPIVTLTNTASYVSIVNAQAVTKDNFLGGGYTGGGSGIATQWMWTAVQMEP